MIQVKQTILNDKKKCDCGSTKIVEVILQYSYTAMGGDTSWADIKHSEYYYCGDCGTIKKFIADNE